MAETSAENGSAVEAEACCVEGGDGIASTTASSTDLATSAPSGSSASSKKWLRISSSCQGSKVEYAYPEDGWCHAPDAYASNFAKAAREDLPARWRGYCSCCKRPLVFYPTEPQELRPKKRRRTEAEGEEKYAYVVAIWGSNVEYVLGAMVLGASLRQSGTKHDLVAMHTNDVPKHALSFLERSGWILREVEYIEAVDTLYQEYCLRMRFAMVFTKLQVFSLTEYSKVLMLDADLLVKQNIDDLFDLPAPAAMVRGPWAGYGHADPIKGQFFFGGHRDGYFSWGQSSGINAGVMLLAPGKETLAQMLQEVKDPLHPEHIRGNGPEQDYLSRYFASSWSHIDVAYNYQLHQMYFALSPITEGADRIPCLKNSDLIKVIHYSSEPKPWNRYLDAELGALGEEDWITEMKRAFTGHKAWVLKEPYAIQAEADRNSNQVAYCADGKLRKILWDAKKGEAAAPRRAGDQSADLMSDHHEPEAAKTQKPSEKVAEKPTEMPAERAAEGDAKGAEADSAPMLSDDGKPLGEVLELDPVAVAGAEKTMMLAVKWWDEAYHALAAKLGEKNLAEAVRAAVKGPPVAVVEEAEGATAETPTGGEASAVSENAAATESNKQEWKKVAGWWLEKPSRRRAVASCSMLPSPKVLLSFDGKTLLAGSGAGAEGLHLAAVSEQADTTCPAPQSFAPGEVAAAVEWASKVPKGTVMLMALIDSDETRVAELLAALVAAGLGCPIKVPPAGYPALTAIGPKGKASWNNTHAASEVAMTTFFEPPRSTA